MVFQFAVRAQRIMLVLARVRKDGINVCMIRKNDNKSESQYIEYAKASQLSDVVYI